MVKGKVRVMVWLAPEALVGLVSGNFRLEIKELLSIPSYHTTTSYCPYRIFGSPPHLSN